jgi:hypothetical protein
MLCVEFQIRHFELVWPLLHGKIVNIFVKDSNIEKHFSHSLSIMAKIVNIKHGMNQNKNGSYF